MAEDGGISTYFMLHNQLELSEPKSQYTLGLGLNILFLYLLYLIEISFENLQIPTGKYQNNIWECSDVMTYVIPALNFVENGVFGQGSVPDYLRTIGYPAMISFLFSVFGKNWVLILQIIQCVLFAFIYPLVTATIRIMLPNAGKRFTQIVFLLLCFSGAYFTRSAVILTDTLFTLLFIAGFYFGMRWYISRKSSDLIFYMVLVTSAALIRPTLSLLPLLNLAMAWWVVKKYSFPIRSTLIRSFVVSIAILFLINISSLRNYINHSFFSPSSVIGVNAFDYLAKKILAKEDMQDVYNTYKAQLEAIEHIDIKTRMRKKIMFETVMQYPISTLQVLAVNSINLFLSNNLISTISNYFGYEWKRFQSSCYSFRISGLLSVLNYLLMLAYALLWFLFLVKFLALMKAQDYETTAILVILFGMFIIPALLTGDGGSRLRLPFEHVLFIFGISGAKELSSSSKMYFYRKKS